jgi:hypothetical protein
MVMIKLLDLLIKTRLFELAYKRKVAIDKVRDLSLNTSTELLKILMYKDSQHQSHWRGKFNGWFKDIKRYSKNTLKEKDLINLLYEEPLGEIWQLEDLIKDIEQDYYSPSYHIDYSNLSLLNQKIKHIFTQISKDITQDKRTNINNYL